MPGRFCCASIPGMRLGEICALKWENIYLDEGFIRINSTLQRIQNVDVKDGDSGRRWYAVRPKALPPAGIFRFPVLF
ncbi:MAG: hypothetical protein V8Q40_11935 [Anaerosacchariphilus sp.]